MNEKLISICIPTWNMADRLEATLNNIVPQALEFKNEVEICISNNASTDNTRDVVIKFKEKYHDLTIKYNENEKNLGFSINLFKVVGLANGKFVWTFGDDKIAENGLKEVVEFIRKCEDKNTGLIVVGNIGYCMLNGEWVIYHNTVDKNKPDIFELNSEDIINRRFDCLFISVLLFNNRILNNIFSDEPKITNPIFLGLESIESIHMVWYCLMFMKYPYLRGYVVNKAIVLSDVFTKFVIENQIMMCALHINTGNLILSAHYAKKHANNYLFNNALTIGPIKGLTISMIAMKVFGCFNYNSFTGVIKLLFHRFRLMSAMLLSSYFFVLCITPSVILKPILRFLFKIKYGASSDERFFSFSCPYITSKCSGGRAEYAENLYKKRK